MPTLVIVAQAITVPNKLSVSFDDDVWLGRLGEMKEFLWSIAAVAYIGLMHARHAELQCSVSHAAPAADQQTLRKAA